MTNQFFPSHSHVIEKCEELKREQLHLIIKQLENIYIYIHYMWLRREIEVFSSNDKGEIVTWLTCIRIDG